MKKTLLLTFLAVGLIASNSAFAGSFSFGNVNINLPDSTSNSAITATSKANSSAAAEAKKAKMQEQIAALNKQLSSVSDTYKTTVNDLATNLLSKDDLKNYKEKISSVASSDNKINIDIAEDGTIAINNALKSGDVSNLKNLSSTKLAAIQKDLATLNNLRNSYTDFSKQATELIKTIQSDPKTALSLASDMINLGKNVKDATEQAKNISTLSSTILSALSKAGVTLK